MEETQHSFNLPFLLLPSKIKKSLSFSFMFFPTSILILITLILLACNAVSIFCLSLPPRLTVPAARAKPISALSKSSSLLLTVEEEIPPSLNKTHPELQPLSPPPSPLRGSPKPERGSKPNFSVLQQTPRSARFSARAKEFFGGSSSAACEARFFMTWISSVGSFGRRELLAVESVFKSHPRACLLILSSSLDSKRGARLLYPFLSRGFRVAAVSPNFAAIFNGTSAEAWFDRLRKGDFHPGEVPLGQNLSNLLRLVVMYKFGGIYLDTDVIVMKSFSGLRNAIGAQAVDAATGNWSRLNNAVMAFDREHPLLHEFIQEFTQTFDGNRWGHNGPYLVSRVASRVAGRPGFNFTVLPPVAFYPVDWSRILSLFDGPRDARHSKWASRKLAQIRKESFAIHLWNRQSRRLEVQQGSAIGHIMSDCCIFCNSSTDSV